MYTNYTGYSLIWLRGTPGLDDVDAWVPFFLFTSGMMMNVYVGSLEKGLGMMMVSGGWLLCVVLFHYLVFSDLGSVDISCLDFFLVSSFSSVVIF